MYKIVIRVKVETTEYDLRALEFHKWPEQAKEQAYRLLGDERKYKEMMQQIEPMSWLVGQLEKAQEDAEVIAREFGI
jgi:hypothetical protein